MKENRCFFWCFLSSSPSVFLRLVHLEGRDGHRVRSSCCSLHFEHPSMQLACGSFLGNIQHLLQWKGKKLLNFRTGVRFLCDPCKFH